MTGMNSVYLAAMNPSENPDETKDGQGENPAGHLLIVWSSADTEVAHKMVFMYALNSIRKGWWEQVTLLVWGPSAKLTSEDKGIRGALAKMKEAGVELIACKACADLYGVSSDLERAGIEVKYSGTYLTDFIKSGKKIISF